VNLDVASVTDPAHRDVNKAAGHDGNGQQHGAFRTQLELAEARRHQLCEERREQDQQQQSGDEREVISTHALSAARQASAKVEAARPSKRALLTAVQALQSHCPTRQFVQRRLDNTVLIDRTDLLCPVPMLVYCR
jgi:hypothetical protein